jgi:hypothetical protein
MRYREVIRAPLWLLAIVYFFMLTLVISIWSALGDNSGLIALAAVSAAIVWLYMATSLTIEVDEQGVPINKDNQPMTKLGQIQA